MLHHEKGHVLAELSTSESLAERPVSWGSIEGHNGAAIAGGDLKWEALAVEIWVALPVLAPVSGHCLPASSGPFDGNRMNITSTTNVGDKDKVKVRVAIDGESDTSPSSAGYPSVSHGNDSSSVLSYVLEYRLREIKMVLRRVTPAASIVGESIVRWAEISGCDHNGARQAPFGVTSTLNLITRSTAQPIVEQSSTESSSVGSIPLAVEVSISTSPTHCPRSITPSIECSMSISPTSAISIGRGHHCQKTHQENTSKSHFFHLHEG
jgi:hypothetical protein